MWALPQEVRQKRDTGPLGIAIPDAGLSFEALERELLDQALRKGNSISAAARLLGMTRRTLQYRLKKFGLTPAATSGEHATGQGAPVPSRLSDQPATPAPDGATVAPDR